MAYDPSGRVVPNAGVSGWQIESQTETVELDARQRAIQGYSVAFLTGQGHRGSVFVPKAQYTPLNVRAAVAAAANTLDEVGKLSG